MSQMTLRGRVMKLSTCARCLSHAVDRVALTTYSVTVVEEAYMLLQFQLHVQYVQMHTHVHVCS